MIYRPRPSSAPSSWIAHADYTHGGEHVCGLTYTYRGFTGCPAWAKGQPCTYCFLKTTFRRMPALLSGVAWVDQPDPSTFDPCDLCGAPVIKPGKAIVDRARAALERWLILEICPSCGASWRPGRRHSCDGEWRAKAQRPEPQVLNAGELADSLLWSPEDNPHLPMLLDLFSDPRTNPYGHHLLLVTKAGLEATKLHLADHAPSPNIILSWSVGNGGPETEPGVPWVFGLSGRAAAAEEACRRGWRVRLRIDPILMRGSRIIKHIRMLQENYHDLRPEVVTLGTLRHRGGRVALSDDLRLNLYLFAMDQLRYGGYADQIGLCKETPALITATGLDPHTMKCNCLP